MIHAELMPDELALGLLGRLRALNGWEGRRMAVATGHLRDALDSDGLTTDGLTNTGLLALAAGMPTAQFVRFHTLLPFRFVASDFGAHVPYGSPSSAGTEQVYGLALPTGRLFACRACASEDVDRWGFSWYRRAHQIPGLEWCERHLMPLSRIDDDDPSGELPHTWFERGAVRDVSGRTLGLHCQKGALRRYLSVCSALLDREAPADSKALNRKLKTRANALGMGVDSEKHESKLKTAISTFADQDWISEHFPDIQKGERIAETRLGRLLRDPRAVAQGADYGLLIALLYDDVDEAMDLLFGIRKPVGESINSARSEASRRPAHVELVMSS